METNQPALAEKALRRSIREAVSRDLPGRTGYILADRGDGFGDFSILVARVRSGALPAHVHPGEAIYIARGSGRFWLEGMPYDLEPGVSGFTPSYLWHSFENMSEPILEILGVVCPGVELGKYQERPQLISPTGALTKVDHLHGQVTLEVPTAPDVVPLIDDRSISPFVVTTLLTLPPNTEGERIASAPVQAWVVVDGTGQVDGPTELTGDLATWDVLVFRGQSTLHFRSRDDVLRIVEIRLFPSELIVGEPLDG